MWAWPFFIWDHVLTVDWRNNMHNGAPLGRWITSELSERQGELHSNDSQDQVVGIVELQLSKFDVGSVKSRESLLHCGPSGRLRVVEVLKSCGAAVENQMPVSPDYSWSVPSSQCSAIRGWMSASGPPFEGSHRNPTARRRLLHTSDHRREGDRQQHMSSQWSAALGMSLRKAHDGLLTVR